LRNKKPLEITVDDPWSRDIYRRIAAGESPYAFSITERIHYARLADKAWQAKVKEEEAEARRRRGGRPKRLSADQVSDAQATVRKCMETFGSEKRWILIDKVQEHLHKHGIRVSESTIIRYAVEPIRGKKRGKE
jgi:Arc/MetJ-type ribon-helix-helix transcriptional regulator